MRKMMQRSLSCLLTLAMVVTMLMTSTLAAEKSAKLEFDYSANYKSHTGLSIEVYKGYPANGYAADMPRKKRSSPSSKRSPRRLTAATSSPLPAPMPTMCTAPATTTFSSSST